jgi:nucleoside-diphosphate-sugar epimerase
MRILVAGATGVIGRRLLPLLLRAGHAVVGLTRTPEKAAIVRLLGAEAAIAEGLDAGSIHAAVTAAKPDVIVHEMTDLKAADYMNFDRSFATSNRLRTEGTDHLIAAARDAGVKRIVAQSFCGWPYVRTGDPVKSEADPLDPAPPRQLRRTLDAIRHLETAVTGSSSWQGLVLRYGAFYGKDTGMFEPTLIAQVRLRRFPLIGGGSGWWSFVHIDDAAAATALAVERGPAGIYNIVDDEPAPVSEWLPLLAQTLGAKPPFRVPAWLARILAGDHLVAMMTEARAGSNAKAKEELGWHPAHPSWRRGFAEVAAEAATQRVAI